MKPNCIIDYNNSMGSVDKVDMILNTINSVRKSLKWYKKYFFHLLDLGIYNSYVAYQEITGKKLSFPDFHLKLIKEILNNYSKEQKIPNFKITNAELTVRLNETHFFSFCEQKKGIKYSPRRRCAVCSSHDKRTDSRYECRKCDVSLCVVPCFELYHTKKI
jgi:hypothetical protein